jgi:WD40 repeat protein
LLAVTEIEHVHLWDRVTRQAIATLDNDTGAVAALTISPDSAWLATIDEEDVVRVWDITTHQCVAAVRTDGELAVINWNTEITVVGPQGFYGYHFINQ